MIVSAPKFSPMTNFYYNFYRKLTVEELRVECRNRGGDKTGNKAVLAGRLDEAASASKSAPEKWTKETLRAKCRERGLVQSGNKPESVVSLQLVSVISPAWNVRLSTIYQSFIIRFIRPHSSIPIRFQWPFVQRNSEGSKHLLPSHPRFLRHLPVFLIQSP